MPPVPEIFDVSILACWMAGLKLHCLIFEKMITAIIAAITLIHLLWCILVEVRTKTQHTIQCTMIRTNH